MNSHDDKEMGEKKPDAKRQPTFVPGRGGTRMLSFAALIERVESQFVQEHGVALGALGETSAVLQEADTPVKRFRLILDAAEYVLAVESVQLDASDRAELVRRVYSNVFGYGPLDDLFLDERVTTILIEGDAKLSVRYDHDEPLIALGAQFDDVPHLRAVIGRILTDANAELRDDTPILEVGWMAGDRPARISVALPPLASAISAEIRVHPRRVPTLEESVAPGFLNADAVALLRRIVRSNYGFCIVGEPEAGKTLLLNMLLNEVPDQTVIAVERAAELRLNPAARRLVVQWRTADQDEILFGDQIVNALAEKPACLVLDEVRSDEASAIAPLLSVEAGDLPRQIWAVRGVADSKRLQSALGILARRASAGQGESLVHALYARLPFVITVARVRDPETGSVNLKLFSIAEWQSRVDTDYPDYVMLMQFRDGEARLTDKSSARWLNE